MGREISPLIKMGNIMKTKTVYLLRNTDTQEVEYVGCTQNPKRRIYQHTRVKPGYSKGEGKFYGRTNLELVPVKEFTDKREAYHYEGKLKKQYGFEWNEYSSHSIEVEVFEYKTKKLVGKFISVNQASIKLGINQSNLNASMRGKRTHANGYYAVSI